MDALPEECQYLTPEHQQEQDIEVLKIHIETLFLLATRGGVEGRRLVSEGGTYPVVRELHLDVEDEAVRRGCERLVDIIMGDEAVGGSHEKVGAGAHEEAHKQGSGPSHDVGRMVTQADVEEDDDDEDNQIVPIF